MGRFGRKTRLTFERVHVARNIEKPLLGTCRKVLGGTKRMLLSEMAFSVVQPDEKARVYNLPPSSPFLTETRFRRTARLSRSS